MDELRPYGLGRVSRDHGQGVGSRFWPQRIDDRESTGQKKTPDAVARCDLAACASVHHLAAATISGIFIYRSSHKSFCALHAPDLGVSS